MSESKPVQTIPSNAQVQLVIAFNNALNAGDVDTMMGLMTPSCVFENTYPTPDGTRYEGQSAVRAFWEEFFLSSLEPAIEIEEIFSTDEHCIMRWVYRWTEPAGGRGHVRGIDVYKISEGLIAEKLSYVKG